MNEVAIERPAPGALTERTRLAGRDALAGRRRGLAAALPFFGPAFIASVAYMDPGNFATNIQAGAGFGYKLLWVVVFANLVAMLFQALSAKLGIVTGRNLAELCRDHLPWPAVGAMWIASEIGAMATDLAELLGAAIALKLLLGLPLVIGTVVAGIATYAMLTLQRYGFRAIEALIVVLVFVLGGCYVIETILAAPDWGAIAVHAVVPWLGGPDSVLLAVGIVGATVMPHAIYLHASLTQDRIVPADAAEARRIVRYSHLDVVVALGFAGLVNMAMMYMAAAVFHGGSATQVADIESAYRTLQPLLGAGAASVFLVSLLASGASSSVVGTLAGQTIMQGFVRMRIPLWLRRVATMLPTLAIVAWGVNATAALVISQVVLSLVLPVPMIALLVFTSRRAVMGTAANGALVRVLAVAAAGVVLTLNAVLLLDLVGVPLPL